MAILKTDAIDVPRIGYNPADEQQWFNRFASAHLLDSVDLFDTSSGVNFRDFLMQNQLTSIPLFDTSSGTMAGQRVGTRCVG